MPFPGLIVNVHIRRASARALGGTTHVERPLTSDDVIRAREKAARMCGSAGLAGRPESAKVQRIQGSSLLAAATDRRARLQAPASNLHAKPSLWVAPPSGIIGYGGSPKAVGTSSWAKVAAHSPKGTAHMVHGKSGVAMHATLAASFPPVYIGLPHGVMLAAGEESQEAAVQQERDRITVPSLLYKLLLVMTCFSIVSECCPRSARNLS